MVFIRRWSWICIDNVVIEIQFVISSLISDSDCRWCWDKASEIIFHTSTGFHPIKVDWFSLSHYILFPWEIVSLMSDQSNWKIDLFLSIIPLKLQNRNGINWSSWRVFNVLQSTTWSKAYVGNAGDFRLCGSAGKVVKFKNMFLW